MRYWQCPECYGTGKVVIDFMRTSQVNVCARCDGTSNALVDGAAERHKRRIANIEAQRTNG